ncbi:hypothetical protein [Sphaerotilus sp.]|uniref:hypothetical protein n=1 Tax=Sphaerotilus sp. TaxID=2093942 RepID=UPI002ACD290D|nr:hypothetical protein [Sphaerotilus sp.]
MPTFLDRLRPGLLAASLAACLAAAGGAAWAQAVPPRGLDIDQHSGVIGAIDPSRQSLQIHGQTLQWDPERLQVLHELTGKPVPLARLRSGMRVRYALEPMGKRAGAVLRIVTLYVQDVQGQP